jgi:hypothetical protein
MNLKKNHVIRRLTTTELRGTVEAGCPSETPQNLMHHWLWWVQLQDACDCGGLSNNVCNNYCFFGQFVSWQAQYCNPMCLWTCRIQHYLSRAITQFKNWHVSSLSAIKLFCEYYFVTLSVKYSSKDYQEALNVLDQIESGRPVNKSCQNSKNLEKQLPGISSHNVSISLVYSFDE